MGLLRDLEDGGIATVQVELDGVDRGGGGDVLDAVGQRVGAGPHQLVPVREPIVCLQPSVQRAWVHIETVEVLVAVVQEDGKGADGATSAAHGSVTGNTELVGAPAKVALSLQVIGRITSEYSIFWCRRIIL